MSERPKRKQINVTRDYSLFTRDSENRDVNLPKHRRLLESMKEFGFLACYPIVAHRNGSGKWHIKDGQNRFTIAQSLGLPVYWVEDETDFDIAQINNTQVVWSLADYANKFARNGKKDYQEALEFAERHRLPIGVCFSILAGTTTFSNIRNAFASGDYKIKDRTWAENVAAVYVPLCMLSKPLRHKTFLEACMAVCRLGDFSITRLLQNAERCRERLVGYSTRDANLEMLESVYNYGRAKLVPLKINAVAAMRDRNAVAKSVSKKAAKTKGD